MKSKKIFGLVCFLFGSYGNALADEIPDYYEEAGFSGTRDYLNQSDSEYIDPFSGTLNLHYTDLVIPGNGGMNLEIKRAYSNVHESSPLPPRSATGLGWTIHFGRLVNNDQYFCPGSRNANNVTDNPLLELPDGSRQIFAEEPAQGSTLSYISRERWRAVCNASGTAVTVWSPEGMIYDMTLLSSDGASYTLYPTKITDRNGNYFDITYETIAATGYTLITGVTASDSRSVTFGYTDKNNSKARLTSVTANGQTWNYGYSVVSGLDGTYYFLTSVTRPGDSLKWQYAYKTNSGNGQYSIKKVTHPHGGTMSYTYDLEKFYAGELRETTVVKTKTTSDGGSWSYSYSPGSLYDTTTVNAPNGTITYKHFGATAAGNDELWKVGLLLEKKIGMLQTENYTWDKQTISYEDYSRPKRVLSNARDNNYYAPILTQKTITRDGTNYTTTFSGYDEYGNPSTINQSGNDTQNKSLTYDVKASKWILHLPKNETISGVSGSIARTYDTDGNLTNETVYGVSNSFTYTNTTTSKGDIASHIDSGGKTTTYSNYHRGTAKNESQPESISITRTVNNSGTVASINNGRNYTTYYSYNGLNQLTGINLPTNTDISISHSKTNRLTTRGGYTHNVEYDVFGRIKSVTASGGDSVEITYDYNALGQKTFESYPSSTAGITYTLDALGRVTKATYAGGNFESFSYLSGNRVKHTDQEGNATTYTYRSYGDPDERVLTKIQAPESITTDIGRNKLGHITSISQGGKTRSYAYNTKFYLTSVTNPETGTTTYGRDNAGNMTSKKVGTSGTTYFTYDDLHRLTNINYPSGTPDVIFAYDKNSNLTSVNNGVGNKSYSYDANDNLTSESLVIDGKTFSVNYGINSLDHVNTITYPSSRVVTFSPNALGRPTKVSTYVTSVSHHPNGTPSNITHANGVSTSISLNSRKWINQISANTTDYIGLTYAYDDNGNITSITDDYDSGYNLSLGYDSVNRLTSAAGTWGSGSISYNNMGNITSYSLGGVNTSYTYSTTGRLTNTSGGIQRSFSYDSYGNVTNNGDYSFSYDDASNLTTASGSVTASYQYDGQNMRASQIKEGTKTYFLYAKNGDLLGEYASDGVFTRENVYLHSKLVATVENVPTAPPSITAPSNDVDGSYSVSWAASSGGGVTSYQLFEASDANFSDAVMVSEGSALSTNITGRAVGLYYYRVRACAVDLCSDFTETSGSTFVGVIPSTPGSLSIPSSNQTGNYSVSWGAAAGDLTHYELYQSTSASFASEQLAYSGANVSTTLSGRQSATYYYRVKACYQSICSGYSVGANAVVVDRVPSAPSSITLPSVESDGSFQVSWGGASGYGKAVSYQLNEATNPSFSGETNVYSGTSLNASLTGRVVNQTYYYRVRACTDTKCSAYQTASTGVLINGQVPGSPTSISVPLSNNTGLFNVSWTSASGDISHYELFQAENAAFTGEVLAVSGNVRSETFNYLASGTYYYRVRACNLIGCGGYTAAANSIDVLQPPPEPSSITAPATDGDGDFTVSWGSSGGSFTYYEFVETSTSGTVTLYTGTNQSYDLKYKTSGEYTYSVRACSPGICSPFINTQVMVQLVDPSVPLTFHYPSFPQYDDTGSYTISWTHYPGNTQFFILEESKDSNFATITKTFNVTNPAQSLVSQLINQDSNGRFYYRVRACLTVDSCTPFYESTYSVLEEGILVLPSADAAKSYTVSWAGPVGSSTTYTLYQATAADFSNEVQVYSGTGLSAQITPDDDGYYYYRLKVCDATCRYRVGAQPVHEIGFKIFPAIMSTINTLLLN